MRALLLLVLVLPTLAHATCHQAFLFKLKQIKTESRLCHAAVRAGALPPPTTTTTTLPCTITVLPYEGALSTIQPDYCVVASTANACVVIHGCGFGPEDVPYCVPWEVMDQCAYRSVCQALYGGHP